MKSNRIFLVVLTVVLVVLLAACKNSSDEPASVVDNQAQENVSNSNNNNVTENEGETPAKPTVSLKEEYLQKLNDKKKVTDNMEAADSSTYAMKKVAGDKFDIWDELLNEVYGVLKEQLSPEEMDQLKEEQRNWITYRDKTAKDASLKYEGGTMEQLEYVAVLANLTEARCYQLVQVYMK